MSTAHDAAIAFLIAQHVQESAQAARESMTVTVKVTMNPETRKVKHAKNEAAPIQHKSNTPGIVMPDRGTLDAKGFLLAMRNAGKRISETGAPFVDQREVRNDQIKAIHAFFYEFRKGVKVAIGYDPNRDFGSQDTAARMLAQRELRGAPKVSEVTAPSRTMGGYVAGMPDMKGRKLLHLQGQEAMAAERMIDYMKDADDVRRSASERELSAALAKVEEERLSHIRTQISELL